MRRTTEAALAAKQIRSILKAKRIPASVKSATYSGGDSVTIDLNVCLSNEALRALETEVFHFQQGRFDGMSDSYEYSNCIEGLPQVRFVFVHNLREAVAA